MHRPRDDGGDEKRRRSRPSASEEEGEEQPVEGPEVVLCEGGSAVEQDPQPPGSLVAPGTSSPSQSPGLSPPDPFFGEPSGGDTDPFQTGQAIEDILGQLQQQQTEGASSSTAARQAPQPSTKWDVEAVERMLRMKLDEFELRLQRKTHPRREVLLAEMQKLVKISEVFLARCEDLGRRVHEALELNKRLKSETEYLRGLAKEEAHE